jgi:hypothetical protein
MFTIVVCVFIIGSLDVAVSREESSSSELDKSELN